jgi:Glycosyl hydrolase catalytic core
MVHNSSDRQRINRFTPRTRLLLATCILLLASCILLPASAPLQAQTSPDSRFGAVEAFRSSEDARELNLGWERILFYWSELQPTGPDDWNIFHVEDGWISTAAAQGRQVVGLLENTPRWATDGPNQIGVPRGLYLPIDDPNNLWAQFVRKVVKRYAGRIDHWIIWNEPDIEPPDDGLQWGGTVKDYYQLVKVAYQAAKQENPNAKIHLAGLTWHHDVVRKRVPYLQRFINEAKKDRTARANNYYFDVATFHVYLTSDSVYDITQALYGILRRNGLKQPIWINETNAQPSDDPLNPWRAPTFVTSLSQQSDFMIHAFALGLAAGAERIAVYKLIDNPPYPEGHPALGLVRADGTRRPAYEAIRVITTHFRDTRSAKLVRTGSTEVVTLDRGNLTTRIAWARSKANTSITLSAFASEGLLVALDGSTQPIKAVNGKYRLTLPGAKCDDPNFGCRVGGHPIILVENTPAKSLAAPVVARTATPLPKTK